MLSELRSLADPSPCPRYLLDDFFTCVCTYLGTQARVLVALLDKEKDTAVKLNAVSALGKLALPLALLPLMPLLKEPDEARARGGVRVAVVAGGGCGRWW